MYSRGVGGLSIRVSRCQPVRSPHPGIHSAANTETTCVVEETTAVKSFDEIPGPKGRALWPIVGAAFLFKPFTPHTKSRPDLLFKDLHRKYGKIVHIRLPYGHTVMLSDPSDMLTVFHNEGKYPIRPLFDLVRTYCDSRQITTLGTMNGEEWRHLRMRVQPKFLRRGAADPYVPAIGQVGDDLVACVRNMEDVSDVDFRKIVFLYTTECLYQFCFSRRLHAIAPSGVTENKEFVGKVRALIATLASPPVLPLYKLWKTKAYRVVEDSMDYLIGLIREEVTRAVQSINDNRFEQQTCPHFIHSLLSSSDLSNDEVAMSMSDFFFGGTDTTSKNLGTLLYHIARYPEQQQVLYEEIRQVVGTGPVTKEKLEKMNYTKACVKESLRLAFPLVPGPSRYLPDDLILSGYKVPKGTLALLSNVAYLHDPECVERPEEFLPQRWLRGEDRQKKEAIPHVAFMPFGMGSRMCIGKLFAEQIMYLCLIKLVQNFELRLKTDPSTINLKYEILPTIDKPLQIIFTPRNV